MSTIQLELTEAAIQYISDTVHAEKNAIALRISVAAGGCSGYSYNFTFVYKPSPDDVMLNFQGASIVISAADFEMLKDCKIDYVKNLLGAKLTIDNPNAKGCCGCGKSFS